MSDNLIEVIEDEKEDESWFEQNIVTNMPVILLIFANVGILVADARAYDVIYRLTESVWKAIGVILFSCAIPFMLWELAWQYKHARDGWRKFSLFMAFLAFFTSIIFGVADFLGIYDNSGNSISANVLLVSAIVLTGFHIIGGLLFFYNDPRIAMRRRHVQQTARIEDMNQTAILANSLLKNAGVVARNKQALIDTYGKNEANQIISALSGKAKKNELKIAETDRPK